MKQANRLLQTLTANKTAWGHWQTLPGTNVSRAIARSGVDWVLIDCEHGNIDGITTSLLSHRPILTLHRFRHA